MKEENKTRIKQITFYTTILGYIGGTTLGFALSSNKTLLLLISSIVTITSLGASYYTLKMLHESLDRIE